MRRIAAICFFIAAIVSATAGVTTRIIGKDLAARGHAAFEGFARTQPDLEVNEQFDKMKGFMQRPVGLYHGYNQMVISFALAALLFSIGLLLMANHMKQNKEKNSEQ